MANLAAFTILFDAKSHSKPRLVQYVITAKYPFKSNIFALQIQILIKLKKTYTTKFLSAGLIALKP